MIDDKKHQEIVIELLGWLEAKNLSVNDAVSTLGYTLTTLVMLAPKPIDFAEEIIEIFRESVKHPPKLIPRPRRTH